MSPASLQGGDRAGGWKEPWAGDLLPRGGLGSATTVDANTCDTQGSKRMLPAKWQAIHLNYSFAERVFIGGLLCISHGENHRERGPHPSGIWDGEDIKPNNLKIWNLSATHDVEERFVAQRSRREIQNT